MKTAILAAGCLPLLLCSCTILVHEAFFDRKDVTKSVAKHGHLARGQIYVLNRDLHTNGRHLFAKGAPLYNGCPRRASGTERYDRRQILNEPVAVQKGTIMRLESTVAESGINIDLLMIDFEILNGPWMGRVLGVPAYQDDLTLGTERNGDLRLNPKVFSRTVVP